MFARRHEQGKWPRRIRLRTIRPVSSYVLCCAIHQSLDIRCGYRSTHCCLGASGVLEACPSTRSYTQPSTCPSYNVLLTTPLLHCCLSLLPSKHHLPSFIVTMTDIPFDPKIHRPLAEDDTYFDCPGFFRSDVSSIHSRIKSMPIMFSLDDLLLRNLQ